MLPLAKVAPSQRCKSLAEHIQAKRHGRLDLLTPQLDFNNFEEIYQIGPGKLVRRTFAV